MHTKRCEEQREEGEDASNRSQDEGSIKGKTLGREKAAERGHVNCKR